MLTWHYRTTRRVLLDPVFGSNEPAAGIKKAQQQAKAATGTASDTGADFASKTNDVGSTLIPIEKREATNPQGFNPADLNSMLVAGEQGAGGATGSTVGQANLEAARTHNTGGLAAVLDEAARGKQRQLSENALNVQGQNAQLKERQRQQGITGLESLYGTDVGANLKAQSLVPEDINAWGNAGKTGWLQNSLAIFKALKPGGIPGMGGGGEDT